MEDKKLTWEKKYKLLLSILAQNVQKALELIPEEARTLDVSDETKALFTCWFCAHLIAEDKATTYNEVLSKIIEELKSAQELLRQKEDSEPKCGADIGAQNK